MPTDDLLRRFVERLTVVPPLEWVQLIRLVKFKTLDKKEDLFRQEERFEDVGFVLKGLLFTTYADKRGKTRVKNFAWEGRLISPYASLIQHKPCNFTATAIEKTLLAMISYKDLLALYDRHACWERLGRKAAENLVIERERREHDLLMLNPLGRYRSFLVQYEPIVDRIPQYLIASFLGITPVSLSRLMSKTSPVEEQ